MKPILTSGEVEIPTQVTVSISHKIITITGPKGTNIRDFSTSLLDFELKENLLEVRCWLGDRRTRAMVQTVCGHVKNMIKGVLAGYQVTMRAVNAHFPINQEIAESGHSVVVRNFMGLRDRVTVNMIGDAKYSRVVYANTRIRDDFLIQGTNLEDVTMSATLFNQSVKRLTVKKDSVKFRDGIYRKELAFIEPDALNQPDS